VRPSPREALPRAIWRWRAAAIALSALLAVERAASVAAASPTAWEGAAAAAAAVQRVAAERDAARDEVLWARDSHKRAMDAEGMLQEAIQVGDQQTRRVLQLQRAVGQTRRTLAACLLRSSVAAAGRQLVAKALRWWALVLATQVARQAVADVKAAREQGQKAREAARGSESIAKGATEDARREIDAGRRRVAAAEKARAALRDECASLRTELEGERRLHAGTKEELGVLERSRDTHAARSRQLELVQGERRELEDQLRALRRKLKATSLLMPPPSPVHAAAEGGGGGGECDGDSDAFNLDGGGGSGSRAVGSATPPRSTPRRAAASPEHDGPRAIAPSPSHIPYSNSSCPPTPRGGGERGAGSSGRRSAAALEASLRRERAEKEQALSLRTAAVRDLRSCREELRRCQSALHQAERGFALARLLAHARSKVGRPAQLLRLLAALRDWHEIVMSIDGPDADGITWARDRTPAESRESLQDLLREVETMKRVVAGGGAGGGGGGPA
jgi:hypothetical protein